jgi:Fur family ferric uptake transcriptional regulator
MNTDNNELRKAGLKITLPRLKILEILESSTTKHVSCEDVYKALLEANEEVSLATIYRVLSQFEVANLVTKHNFEGGPSVFELSSVDHHDHFVCNRCGSVEEFYDELIERQQEKIASQLGFEITDHSMNLYGICKTCRAESGK